MQEDWKPPWVNGSNEILAVKDLAFFFTAKANAVFCATTNMLCAAFQDSAELDFVSSWRGLKLSQYHGTELLVSQLSL